MRNLVILGVGATVAAAAGFVIYRQRQRRFQENTRFYGEEQEDVANQLESLKGRLDRSRALTEEMGDSLSSMKTELGNENPNIERLEQLTTEVNRLIDGLRNAIDESEGSPQPQRQRQKACCGGGCCSRKQQQREEEEEGEDDEC